MMKCVIPCAGEGKRLGSNKPKVLNEVNGKTLLEWTIDAWSWSVGADGYVIIVSRSNLESIKSYAPSQSTLVVQEEPKGLADAILKAEPYVGNRFIVSLGDCLLKGRFEEKPFDLGIGVIRLGSPEVNKNYLVRMDTLGFVKELAENPKDNCSLATCGMGVYFLDKGVFNYIEANRDKEFTGILQTMVNSGEKIAPVWFEGEYINVNTPEDIKEAEDLFK